MATALELLERPVAEEIHMVAGWRQWANAGDVSSGLPQHLIDTLGARKIGHIRPNGFYLFQTPVSQFLFRPKVKFVEGHREEMSGPSNDVYYWGNEHKGLVIFLGDEPHMDIERYAEAFFDIVRQLGVRRVATTGGVYAVVPHDKERSLSCTYSLPGMKAELGEYAVNFSNYEGGVSIGSYMNDMAEKLGVEYFAFYAFVPMYDFSQVTQRAQNISVDEDYRAWHDILRRLDHMFKLSLPLADLARKSAELEGNIDSAIEELAKQLPNVPVREYIAKLTADFVEQPFTKLDDVWQDAFKDLFGDAE